VIPSTLLLRTSNPGGFIFYFIVGICAGIYIFIRGFRLLQRRHLILDTPFSKIRSAPMGIVELSGLAVGPHTISAPITNRLCYCHRTLVWEWKQDGKNKRWVKVAAECMHVPFFLDDNTAKVMIDPRGADLDLHRDFQQEFCDGFFTIKEEAPDNVRNFLSRHGIRTTNKIKVEEFCIKPKNALFVLGTLDENPGLELTPDPIQDNDGAGWFVGNALSFSLNTERVRAALSPVTGDGNLFSGILTSGLQHDPAYDATYEKALFKASTSTASTYNTSAPGESTRVIRLSPDPDPVKAADMTQQQKIAAALIKAGINNPTAWATAGITPSALAVNQDRVNQDSNNSHGSAPNPTIQSPPSPSEIFNPHPPVVLMKGQNNPTFLISWRSQRDLARALGWKCTLMIWGGPALALVSLYALLSVMHWL
jgi:hypothetical protein